MRRNPSIRLLLLALSTAALLPATANALSEKNSDGADLVLADMALSRGDCRGGTERYVKAALASDDARISDRANKVATDCQPEFPRRSRALISIGPRRRPDSP